MTGNNRNDLLLRVAGPLLVASILGAYGFSVTRASQDDVSRVSGEVDALEEEMEDEGRRIRDEIGDVVDKLGSMKESLHALDKSQSVFRAEIRQALDIGTED